MYILWCPFAWVSLYPEGIAVVIVIAIWNEELQHLAHTHSEYLSLE